MNDFDDLPGHEERAKSDRSYKNLCFAALLISLAVAGIFLFWAYWLHL